MPSKTSPASQNARCAPSQRPVTPRADLARCRRADQVGDGVGGDGLDVGLARRTATGPTQPSCRSIDVGDRAAAAAEEPAVPAAVGEVELVVDAAVEAAGRRVDLAQLGDRRDGERLRARACPAAGGAAPPAAARRTRRAPRAAAGRDARTACSRSGCSESVTVARTAPGGAPVAASSNSRPPTPSPCASGSTKRLLRNHQSPRSSPLPQATIWRPVVSERAAPAAGQLLDDGLGHPEPLAVVPQEVPVGRGLLVVLGDALAARPGRGRR